MNSLAKDVRIGGKSNFLAALKTAQLALKNRQNKNQRQRVIMFVGSPIEVDAGELVKLGKLFKKNNVAIDVINFGTENTTNDNTEKLEQLIAAVNTSDNSHLVSIPPGPHIFADLVLTSAIMQSGGGGGIAGVPSGAGAAASGGNSGAGHVGGIDPNMDPSVAHPHACSSPLLSLLAIALMTPMQFTILRHLERETHLRPDLSTRSPLHSLRCSFPPSVSPRSLFPRVVMCVVSEMAMVLRMSMEEERLRQQKASGEASTAGAPAGAPAAAAAGGAVSLPLTQAQRREDELRSTRLISLWLLLLCSDGGG